MFSSTHFGTSEPITLQPDEEITTLKNAITLAPSHGCAGMQNGDVVCWGDSTHGRLESLTCREIDIEAGEKPVVVKGHKLRSFTRPHGWQHL